MIRLIVASCALLSPCHCACRRSTVASCTVILPCCSAFSLPIVATWAAISPDFAPAFTCAKLALATLTFSWVSSKTDFSRSPASNIAISCPAFTRSPSLTKSWEMRSPSKLCDTPKRITSPSGSNLPSAVIFLTGGVSASKGSVFFANGAN